MAKPHVSEKIEELQNAGAENIVEEVIKRVNPLVQNDGNETIKVVLNLADDLKGSWTNRYTVDYDSKFKIGDTISVDGTKGIIIEIDNNSITLRTDDRKIIIPLHMFASKKIEVFDD